MKNSIKIAINGFGRIGRSLFHLLFQHKNIEVLYINDLMSYKQASYLFKYDSIYTKNKASSNLEDVIYTQEKNNLKLNFEHADIVLETTGIFSLKSQNMHYNKKVIITSPSKDILKPNITTVNEKIEHNIISASSCTTNAIAPIINMLLKNNITPKNITITVIHSYTTEQSLLDGQVKSNIRVTRGSTNNIIPLQSSVGNELKKIYPDINFSGVNVRVPISNAMYLYLLIQTKDTIEDIKDIIEQQNNHIISFMPHLYFSSLAKENLQSSIITDYTQISENLLCLTILQDNERAYASRIIDLINYISK